MSILFNKVFVNDFQDISEQIFKYCSWKDKINVYLIFKNPKKLLKEAKLNQDYKLIVYLLSVCNNLPKYNYTLYNLLHLFNNVENPCCLLDFIIICNKLKKLSFINFLLKTALFYRDEKMLDFCINNIKLIQTGYLFHKYFKRDKYIKSSKGLKWNKNESNNISKNITNIETFRLKKTKNEFIHTEIIIWKNI